MNSEELNEKIKSGFAREFKVEIITCEGFKRISVVVDEKVTVQRMLSAINKTGWCVYHQKLRRYLRDEEDLFDLLDPNGTDVLEIFIPSCCEG